MITLDVYFDNSDLDGQAMLIENLITNKVELLLKTTLYLGEVKAFIDKATNMLNNRYEKVNVNIHWNTPSEEKLEKESKNNEEVK